MNTSDLFAVLLADEDPEWELARRFREIHVAQVAAAREYLDELAPDGDHLVQGELREAAIATLARHQAAIRELDAKHPWLTRKSP